LYKKSVAIIVAHPDDETLWAGGTILSHPSWDCFIVCLCRQSDKERATRFNNALKVLKAKGVMADLNDGPEQHPLKEQEVERAILDKLPQKHFDLLITHSPTGEYTKHLRHEEVSKAVITMWSKRLISVDELWFFAYEDGNKDYFPKPILDASIYRTLTKRIWLKKYYIITEVFGFKKDSWEAQATTKDEAFWRFTDSFQAEKHLYKYILNELSNYSITKT